MDGTAAAENVASKLEGLAVQDQTAEEGGSSSDSSSSSSSSSSNPASRSETCVMGLVDMAGEVLR